MNKWIMGLAAACCAPASAGPIALPGGPLYLEVRTAEQYSASNDIGNALNPARAGGNEGNWGIVQVDTIRVGQALTPAGWQIDPLGPTVFSDSLGGPQILGAFYGVHNNPAVPGQAVTASGGTLDLYHWDSNNQDVDTELAGGASSLAKRSGAAGSQYTGFTCLANTAGCSFLARLIFTAGADPNSLVNTIHSPPSTALFDAYFSVDVTAPGAWTAALDSNYFSLNPLQQACGPASLSCLRANDIRAGGRFTQNNNAGWSVAGTDIVSLRKTGALQAFVVPEPDALGLTALALAGLALSQTGRRLARPAPLSAASPR